MTRPRAPQQKRRLNLAVQESMRSRLHELLVLTGAVSNTEVIRRALEVLHFIISAQQRGDSLVHRTAEGKEQKVFFVI